MLSLNSISCVISEISVYQNLWGSNILSQETKLTQIEHLAQTNPNKPNKPNEPTEANQSKPTTPNQPTQTKQQTNHPKSTNLTKPTARKPTNSARAHRENLCRSLLWVNFFSKSSL